MTTSKEIEQYTSTTKLLIEDINKALDLYKQNPQDQFCRRAYVRAVFAYVEGHLYRFKQLILSFEKIMNPLRLPNGNNRILLFTTAEAHMLQERAYVLRADGTAEERYSMPNFFDNIQFAYRIYTNTLEVDFKLDCGGKGWESLRKAQKIRNRITHPKEITDLFVSDEDITKVIEAAGWYEQTSFDCINEIHQKSASNTLKLRPLQKDTEALKDRVHSYPESI